MCKNCSSFYLSEMFVCSVTIWRGIFTRILLFTATSYHINPTITAIQSFVDLIGLICHTTCYCSSNVSQIIIIANNKVPEVQDVVSLMLTQLWNNSLLERKVDLTNSTSYMGCDKLFILVAKSENCLP